MDPRGVTLLQFKLQNGSKTKGKIFVGFIHLLYQGWPMIDFEDFKCLFQFLKAQNCLHKHWIDSTKWTMVKMMHNIVLRAIKVVLQKTLVYCCKL